MGKVKKKNRNLLPCPGWLRNEKKKKQKISIFYVKNNISNYLDLSYTSSAINTTLVTKGLVTSHRDVSFSGSSLEREFLVKAKVSMNGLIFSVETEEHLVLFWHVSECLCLRRRGSSITHHLAPPLKPFQFVVLMHPSTFHNTNKYNKKIPLPLSPFNSSLTCLCATLQHYPSYACATLAGVVLLLTFPSRTTFLRGIVHYELSSLRMSFC